MEASRAVLRVRDIKDNVCRLRRLLVGKTQDQVTEDDDAVAAMERYLERVSEASRHLPTEWKERYGADLNWRAIADLGNKLRHVYRDVDLNILWSIYTDDLDPLEAAIDAMIAAHPIEPR